MRSSLEDLAASMDKVLADDPTGWTDTDFRDGLATLLPVANQLCMLISHLAGAFDHRQLSTQDGFRTAKSWLIAFARLTPAAAAGYLSRARLLAQLPALAGAARTGAVSADHLRKVGALVEQVGVDAVRDLDDTLATLAGTATPADLGAATERIRAHLDPDGPDPDPEARHRRALHIHRVGSLFSVRGFLDAEGGSLVLTALNALMRPPGPDDSRDFGQRCADALVDLTRLALVSSQLPLTGGVRPQLGILLTPEALLDPHATTPGPATAAREADATPFDPEPEAANTVGEVNDENEPCAAAAAGASRYPLPDDPLGRAGIPLPPEWPWTSWKARLPASVAQRIACDCEVWRIVLDPATGLPLEVGRAHRIVPHWLRKALHARDQGCRWPGCTIPAAWTEVHHLIAWYFGGLTEVENCLILCTFHHGLVHHERAPQDRWRIQLDPTNGEVHVGRPDGTSYELGPSQPYRGPAPARPGP